MKTIGGVEISIPLFYSEKLTIFTFLFALISELYDKTHL